MMPRQKFEVRLERPKWSEKKANEDHKKGVASHQQGYDWSKPQIKNVMVDAKDVEHALELARDAEEARLDEEARQLLLKKKFEDMVAVEFWKREQRYVPMSAEYRGEIA